jgi:hypothetical protein
MEGDAAASTLPTLLALSLSFARARTVIQRYQQIAESQRQTASKRAKREGPAAAAREIRRAASRHVSLSCHFSWARRGTGGTGSDLKPCRAGCAVSRLLVSANSCGE